MEYLNLLKRERVLLKLSTIQIIVYFGAWFTNVAIYTLLIELNASAITIALVASMHFLPAVLQAPFTGPLIDRLSPKPLMLILILIEILTTISFLFIDSLNLVWLLLFMLYIKMSANSFYFTAEMSLLPKILKDRDLELANELHSIIWSFSYTFGMALSGATVYLFGVKVAILIDITLFVVALFTLYTLELKIELKRVKERFFSMIIDGFNYIKRDKLVIHLILLHSSVGLTAFDTLITLLADFKYKEIVAASLAIGFLNATRAFALMIGPLLLSKYLSLKNFQYILLFQALSILIWGYIQINFYLSLIGSFFVGIFTTTIWSYTYTLLHKRVDEKYYGRVIAYNDMVFMLVGVFTSMMIGILADAGVKLSSITYIIGTLFILATIYYRFILRRLS